MVLLAGVAGDLGRWAAGPKAGLLRMAKMSEEVETKAETTRTFTPLHSAALLNDVKRANALIDAGVNINAQSEDGLTPLLEALCEGDGDFIGSEVARLLIESGADVSLRDKSGATALEYVNHYFEANIQHLDMTETFLGHPQRELIDLIRRASARSR